MKSKLISPTPFETPTIDWDKPQIVIRQNMEGVKTIIATTGKHMDRHFEGSVLFGTHNGTLEFSHKWTKEMYTLPKEPITITFENEK